MFVAMAKDDALYNMSFVQEIENIRAIIIISGLATFPVTEHET
jgi:hypothetical protein